MSAKHAGLKSPPRAASVERASLGVLPIAIKRSDPYSSRWGSCDELGGGIPERDLDAPAADWQLIADAQQPAVVDVDAEPCGLELVAAPAVEYDA